MDRLLSATLGGTIRLRTTLDPNLWPALVDPSHLELIVMNFVINARDAMLSGELPAIETFNAVIEKEPSAPHEPVRGQYAGLSVIDTGTGIPDDVLPRIFEPFFTTKKPEKGSGSRSGSGLWLRKAIGRRCQHRDTCRSRHSCEGLPTARRTGIVNGPARRVQHQKR